MTELGRHSPVFFIGEDVILGQPDITVVLWVLYWHACVIYETTFSSWPLFCVARGVCMHVRVCLLVQMGEGWKYSHFIILKVYVLTVYC